MTVCIAAACNIGAQLPPFIVAASDRMITIGGLEYEPLQRKVFQLATSTIALFAGDMQLHAAVAPKAQARIRELVSDRDPQRLTVEEVAQSYAIEFAIYRRVLAEREILFPRNMDFDKFTRQQHILPHYQVREIDALLAAHAIDSSAIVAGVDHTGAHIYKIRDPGVAESFDTPFFACIGSGKDIAEAQFMVARYDKTWSLPKALWLAFSAKARAEVAGGVGPQTDLIVVTAGSIEYANDPQLAELYRLFGQMRDRERAAQEEPVTILEGYFRAASETQADQRAGQDASPSPQAEPPSEPRTEERGTPPEEPTSS